MWIELINVMQQNNNNVISKPKHDNLLNFNLVMPSLLSGNSFCL